MTSKEIQKTRTQIEKLKHLKAGRKACREAAKAGADDTDLRIEVMKLEEWLQTNFPALDIHSDKAINMALRNAKSALKVAEMPLDSSKRKSRRRQTPLIEVASLANGNGSNRTDDNSGQRREATTVRRAPAHVFARKA